MSAAFGQLVRRWHGGDAHQADAGVRTDLLPLPPLGLEISEAGAGAKHNFVRSLTPTKTGSVACLVPVTTCAVAASIRNALTGRGDCLAGRTAGGTVRDEDDLTLRGRRRVRCRDADRTSQRQQHGP